MEIPLNESVSVTLDGSGNGTVRLGPSSQFQTWAVDTVSCTVSSNTKEPVFKFYRGRTADQSNYIDGTFTGSADSTNVSFTLFPNMVVTGVFTGGDVGALATMTFVGTTQIPSR